ncbi:hypothetical protein [Pseudomonas koreensis]|uniref:Uncharacterized protein n=1 Tax=Pseudomonas koreensis TaxID=198620 RepID=A0A9X2XL57_9PSED|nr:hypothetical protein [Pseudomonas koreensis]MCU7250454.1 hypothetical protein [Pseudomonas koreensis]
MHPEHFDFSSPVFLPITQEACAALLEADGATTLGPLTDAELAAVLVIQNLAEAAEKDLTAGAAERVLARLIAWAVEKRQADGAGLLAEARRLFDPRKLYFGLNAIKRLNLRCLLDDEVAARDYLLPDGKWDVEYKIRHHARNNPFRQQTVTPRHRERWLSAAQDKLVRTFRANLDEDLHVQGYAGIGKSHLLGTLMECLRPGGTLVLARTAEKLRVLRERMGNARDGSTSATFDAFAQKLLLGPRSRPASVSLRGASRQAVAQELNIHGFQARSGQATLDVCLKVLERYCRSREHSLSARHFPHFKQALSEVDARALLEYSSRLWVYLEANPAWAGQTGFGALLMIKRASLAGCSVPARYTHILIDESQDIPESLLQIIERGRQVLITLGDEYQQPGDEPVRRKREVRQSDVCYSVRSGRNVERLVNPLIARHSKKSKIPFEGARDADVGVEHYPQGFVPPEGCAVLTASRWDTVKWAIELRDANCPFIFQDAAAQRDLEHFMITAIEMFKSAYYNVANSEKGPHPYFSDMADWRQVREASQFDEAFLWVENRLENGFKVADVTALNRVIGRSDTCCMLMLAEDAGGMEFDRVLLTTELLTTVKFKDAYEFDQRICAVYIAISRARRQLYLPYDVVEWVDYHVGHDDQKFRELHGY